MYIFLSYSSKYRELCERLCLALEGEGHDVFMDRTDLDAGRAFDKTIREAIEHCDLLIFLLSPESVAEGSYARAELELAQQRWHHPSGHVLPVMVAPTEMRDVPTYLHAVTLLQPKGEVVAETLAAIARLKTRRPYWWFVGATAAAVLCIATYLTWSKLSDQRRAHAEIARIASELTVQCESGEHGTAWRSLEAAVAQHPQQEALRASLEDCGMRWLREIRVRVGKETMSGVVKQVVPVLMQAAARATGPRAADLHAHIGWGDWLRRREGESTRDPRLELQRALDADAANSYAHAMLGLLDVVSRRPLADVRRHFETALQSGRDRSWVRAMQLGAYFWYDENNFEAIRAADEMRRSGEAPEQSWRDRLWSGIFGSVNFAAAARQIEKSGVAPVDLAGTFEWLYPEKDITDARRPSWRYWRAWIARARGDEEAARSGLIALRDDLRRDGRSGGLLSAVEAALRPVNPGSATP